MLIEVWSDFVCPWCYIGKRRLESALGEFEHADDVEIVWRSYQLDPSVEAGTAESLHEHMSRKFGGLDRAREMTDRVTEIAAGDGLEYRLDRARVANTFDAHRVAHLAREHGAGAAVHVGFMRAYVTDAEDLGDHETLVRLAAEAGVPEDDIRRVLAGDAFGDEVRSEIGEAGRLGASGVPFFVMGRTHGVAGAQPTETFLGALREAYSRVGVAAR
ncbi:putative DsbA family dithiol-disulfide isomerase [Haloactinopolyspora alba]|uniref:Putative DsbA family dithiol-disulfide isomerase n=1 Tax=Haloactinopolyspora alba TaxID=648780 RepID=A0A2P8EBY6_9ACTN|nr:DsbA family oxidoreductase [Haloactinopolyspora alba]PSL06972.1 putative DsbA family dithiol-disulfide isomerase [Haloactinopolyspora alba]